MSEAPQQSAPTQELPTADSDSPEADGELNEELPSDPESNPSFTTVIERVEELALAHPRISIGVAFVLGWKIGRFLKF